MGWAKPSGSVASLGLSQLWPVACKWGLKKQQNSSLGMVGVETFLRTSDFIIQNQSGPGMSTETGKVTSLCPDFHSNTCTSP